jgi:hypothetical protein
MKKLLLTILFTLVLSGGAFANNTHSYLLNNELVINYEGQNWRIKFLNDGKISSEFNGNTTYDFSWRKINDNGTYEIYHSKFKKPNLWEINLNNHTFIETDLRGSNKKYTYQILKSQTNQSSSTNNANIDISFNIKQKKEQCTAIGFKPETEKFADCVLRLVELDVKQQNQNQITSAQSSGNDALVKQLKKQSDLQSSQALINLGQQLMNPKKFNSNIYKPKVQRCTIQGYGSFANMICR